MHTELVSAQVVRCWQREVGSGGLRSEEGPERRAADFTTSADVGKT